MAVNSFPPSSRHGLCIGKWVNDEPQRAALDMTVSVANIEHRRAFLKALPIYKTEGEGGRGTEMALHLLNI